MRRPAKRRQSLFAAAVLLLTAGTARLTGAEEARGPLHVHPGNPRYFTDGSGKAIYLTGSHTWGNLQDFGPSDPPEVFDYPGYLEFLKQHNHNFMRLWAWEGPRAVDSPGSVDNFNAYPMPYRRTGPGLANDGKPRFDVTRFNEAYFERLRNRVTAARDRGIYVGVMLFEGWSVWNFLKERQSWRYHPFHKDNNINGIDGDPGGNGEGEEVHFLQIPAVTRLQEAYVRRVIDTVNDLDNALFEISNESTPSASSKGWEYYMVRYIHKYEAGKPNRHPVGVTSNSRLDMDVLDSSPSEWVSLRRVRRPFVKDSEEPLAVDPPAADGRKVSILDTDHIGLFNVTDPDLTRAWVWKSFLRGHNPIWMEMHQTNPMGDYSPQRVAARKAMGHTLSYARRMDLAAMVPREDLASSRYCLAHPGKEYLIYVPSGGQVTVDLSAISGQVAVEWFNPRTAEPTRGDPVQGGTRRSVTAPFEGDAVVYMTVSKGTG
jgi:hypothetical protein